MALKSCDPGRAFPSAPARGLIIGGHDPSSRQSAKVIDTHHIDELGQPPDPLDPPGKSVALHVRPVEDRISPELTVCREQVRWHTGHHFGAAIGEQSELIWIGPDIGAVERHVNGDVANDAECRGHWRTA